MASRSEAASGTTPGARRRRRWRHCAGSSTGSTRWSRATSPLRCGGRWGFSGSPAGATLRAPVPRQQVVASRRPAVAARGAGGGYLGRRGGVAPDVDHQRPAAPLEDLCREGLRLGSAALLRRLSGHLLGGRLPRRPATAAGEGYGPVVAHVAQDPYAGRGEPLGPPAPDDLGGIARFRACGQSPWGALRASPRRRTASMAASTG